MSSIGLPSYFVFPTPTVAVLPTELPPLNTTALSTEFAPSWVEGPITRGTFQILWTCIFILFLCVYTAIHPNVPAPWDGFWSHNGRRTKWVLIAIFAPEAVVLAAWQQFVSARRFRDTLRKIAKEERELDEFVKRELPELRVTTPSDYGTHEHVIAALQKYHQRTEQTIRGIVRSVEATTQQGHSGSSTAFTTKINGVAQPATPAIEAQSFVHSRRFSLQVSKLYKLLRRHHSVVDNVAEQPIELEPARNPVAEAQQLPAAENSSVTATVVNADESPMVQANDIANGHQRLSGNTIEGAYQPSVGHAHRHSTEYRSSGNEDQQGLGPGDLESNHEQPTSNPSIESITLRQAFYAIMGGYVTDISELHNKREIVTITPSGLLFLARYRIFFPLTDKTIQDKSKADTLAKIIIGVQVVYIVALVAARQLEGLPITLLELHVFVHIICATTMFLLWVKKPKDIKDPTVIDSTIIKPLLAWMIANNDWGKRWLDGAWRSPFDKLQKEETVLTEAQMLVLYPSSTHLIPKETTPSQKISDGPIRTQFFSPLRSEDGMLTTEGRRHTVSYGPPQGIDTVCELANGETLRCGVGVRPSDDRPPITYSLSTKDRERLALCAAIGPLVMDAVNVINIINNRPITYERRYKPLESIIASPEGAEVTPNNEAGRGTVDQCSGTNQAQVTEIPRSEDATPGLLTTSSEGVEAAPNSEAGRAIFDPSGGSGDAQQTDLPASKDVPSSPKVQAVQYQDKTPYSLDVVHNSLLNSTFLLCPREPNFQDSWFRDFTERSQRIGTVYTVVAFTLLSTAYGGLHLLAWNFNFPTSTERLLWIGAAISIMVGGLIYLFRCSLWTLSLLISRSKSEGRLAKFWKVLFSQLDSFLSVLFAGLLAYYMAARIYLVVEAFVSIRKVPVGVYYVPSWVSLLPNFG